MKEIIESPSLPDVFRRVNLLAKSLTDPHAPKFFKSNVEIAIDELCDEGVLKIIAGDNPLVDEFDEPSHLLINEREKEIARRNDHDKV